MIIPPSFATICHIWVSHLMGFPLTAQKDNSYRQLWMLGLALTLPMILLSGPLAGYFISYLLIHKFGCPGYLTPLFMGLGFLASGLQSYNLIKRLNANKED